MAYHDVPDKAYEVFLGAVTTKYLEQGLVIPSLVEAHNPAGQFNLVYIVCHGIINHRVVTLKLNNLCLAN